MAYIGTSPSNGVRRVLTYTATANQTTFTGTSSEGITLTYSDGNYVDVFQNGVLLGTADYTATSGTSIVLVQGASVNDIIVIIVYDVFSVADTVSQSAGGTFEGNVTMAGTLGVTGAITGTLATAAQANITSVGTLTSFRSTGIDDNADALAMTIDSSENVGIGTASPTEKLSLLNSSGDVGIKIQGNTRSFKLEQNNYGLRIYDIDASAERFRVDANGNVLASNGTITANRASADQNILGEATTAGYASRLQLKAANYSGGSYNGIQSFQGDAGPAWEISGAKANATNIMKFTVGNTMAMEIQGNGFVTVPAQVHALFEKTTTTSVSGGAAPVVIFNEQRINTGSSYNSTNGRFTAPVAGRYQFSVDFQCNGQYNQMHLGMYMNGGAIGNIDPWVNYGDSMRGANRSLTINLAAGDYLQAAVHFGNNSGTLEANRHRASFYLLG